MSVKSLSPVTPCHLLAILLLLVPSQASAAPRDEASDAAPLHAHLTASWRDWECDRGYRKANGECAQIELLRTPS